MHPTLPVTTLVDHGSLGEASAALLGWNLEWISDTPRDLTGELLDHPTFRGPVNLQTGLAEPWKKFMEFGPDQAFAVAPGQGLDGGTAQRLHRWGTNDGIIVQPGRRCRAGERLTIVLWARCQGAPVTLTVGLRGRGLPGPLHAQAEFAVNAGHFVRYAAEVVVARDDDRACAFIAMSPGIVYLDRFSIRPAGIGSERPDVIAAMDELAIPDLRWPGGCVASQYHWWRGVGPSERRHDAADPSFHWSTCYTWGTDEYLDLCRRLGARPHITVNIGTGTPDEAAQWAAYCAGWWRSRGLTPPPTVFQIGNEHYGAHEIGHTDPQRYVAVLRAYVPGIRAAYPGAIICTTSFVSERMAWLRALLAAEPGLADLAATHHYACRLDPDPRREALALAGDVLSFAAELDESIAALDAAGSPLGYAVTEWGAFRAENHHDERFCEAQPPGFGLFAASMLNAYLRRCRRLGLANIYNLINAMPAIIARDGAVQRTVTHAVTRFWRHCLPATVHDWRGSGPVLPVIQAAADGSLGPWNEAEPSATTMPVVDAVGGADWLLLTNRHPERSAPVAVPAALRGATVDLLVPVDGALVEQPAGCADDTVVIPPFSHARLTRIRP
jgi:hypothetical protein